MDPAIVYSPGYDFVLPESTRGPELESLQRFDGRRATRAWEKLLLARPGAEGSKLTPEPATDADLALAHSDEYLASLKTAEAIIEVIELPQALELPLEFLDQLLVAPQRLAVGGTLLALREAFNRGVVINLSGGYHHAKREQGGGFCFFSDISIAAKVAQRDFGLERIAVVDLDAHQGNGVSSILTGDDAVAIFDVYNGEIYPQDEEARLGLRWDHPVPSGFTGRAYLELLERELPRAFDEFEPQLVIYNAGTDLVAGDPLGLLQVSASDVSRRDAFVLAECARRSLPIFTTASGGYTDHSHELLFRLAEMTQRPVGAPRIDAE